MVVAAVAGRKTPPNGALRDTRPASAMKTAPPGPGDVPAPRAALTAAAVVLAAAAFGAVQPEDPLASARQLLDEGRLEEAVPHLERARSARPEDPNPVWMLAVARLRLGHLEPAAELAGEVARLTPRSPNGPLLAGTALAALGRFDEAETALREAVARDPRNPEARRDLAALLARAGRVEEAMARFEALAADYPGRAEALAPLGVLYVQAGRRVEGLGTLVRAAQVDPASFEARHHLGALYSALGQFGPADEHLAAALSLRPGAPGTLLEICLLRSREDRLEEAKAACAEAAEAAPGDAEAQFKSGDVLHYLQENEAAERAYRDAIRLASDHARARMRLGLLLHETGRSAEAIEVLGPVANVAAGPELDRTALAGGLATLGQAFAAEGRPEDAEGSLRAATETSPTTPEPWLHLGNLLARSGDPDKAVEGRTALTRFTELRRSSDRTNELKAMVNRDPGAPEPKKALVRHLIAGGAPEAALEESGRLRTLAPAEPVHHLLFAEALAAVGRDDDARATLDAALDDWPDHPELTAARQRLAADPGR